MDHADLRLLLDFNYWARDRVFQAVGQLTPEQYTRDLGNSFKSVRDTLVHLYSAEWAWYQRWEGISPAAHRSADEFPDVATLRSAWAGQGAKMRAFMANLGDEGMDRILEYRTFNGQPGASTYGQILQHVVNHGSYHRGQLTTMYRQLGAPPAKSMDLIAFFRERAARQSGG